MGSILGRNGKAIPEAAFMDQKAPRYGIGINSLSFRLMAIYVVLVAICLGFVTKPFLAEHSASDTALHLAYALAGLILTAGLMALMSRKLTRPISQLTEVARTIADGDLDVEVPVDCSCEIGALSESMSTMVSRLRSSTAEIRDLANKDTITGLPNRRSFQALLERQLEGGATGSVFFIDIFELRRVNDHFGHDTSDQLLRNIVRLLENASPCRSRKFDPEHSASEAKSVAPVLARFGSTELVLLVPDFCEISQIEALSDWLHNALSNAVEVSGRQFHPQIAIGAARYPDDSASAIEIIQYAALACNTAMGIAEARKTVVFHPRLLDAIKARDAMEHDLRTAIAEHQFEVYYQPKVSANTWSLTGVEALVRLNHPTRGVVGPAEFIPIAEMTGLISEIGLIVLDEAISQCAAWARKGQMIEVSINVSLEQCKNAAFSDLAIELIRKHDCPAHLITIEITETVANTSISGICSHFAALRAAGMRIAIDDFGTGYSNLAHIHDLEFDVLKVDRAFVIGIESEGPSREVSRAIIQLGKNLGCRVVVEGTETPGQVAAAALLGCDEIQGFYFSKPMKRGDFEAWNTLRKQRPARGALDAFITAGPSHKPRRARIA
ncbi:MAG: hypothetical protein COA37_23145 [Hoeflea sp.]|uniref:putative bifunctional diguanylate cyclase/phosphodiesterase n=1 Tax=Hoeflea sp. TaxID=1940281 RepID=UPI000C0F9F44|nr:bifunctional diguanylate cyclase/phosphodiesterase [Hoeflea sp.]PHR17068.1 MAG: hypothetical protein COA37_23145 [Hoeflea sp.]